MLRQSEGSCVGICSLRQGLISVRLALCLLWPSDFSLSHAVIMGMCYHVRIGTEH